MKLHRIRSPLARLGGWSGYRSQKPPGITTLIRGLYQFESTFFWLETRSRTTCVYTVAPQAATVYTQELFTRV